MPRSPSRSPEPPRHIRVSHPHVARNPNMRDDRTLDIVPEDRESQDTLMKQPGKVKLFEQCSAGLEQGAFFAAVVSLRRFVVKNSG